MRSLLPTCSRSLLPILSRSQLAYEKLKETLSVIPEEVVERVEFETLGGGAGAGGQDGAKVRVCLCGVVVEG